MHSRLMTLAQLGGLQAKKWVDLREIYIFGLNPTLALYHHPDRDGTGRKLNF